jgi:hypothetical protein
MEGVDCRNFYFCFLLDNFKREKENEKERKEKEL